MALERNTPGMFLAKKMLSVAEDILAVQKNNKEIGDCTHAFEVNKILKADFRSDFLKTLTSEQLFGVVIFDQFTGQSMASFESNAQRKMLVLYPLPLKTIEHGAWVFFNNNCPQVLYEIAISCFRKEIDFNKIVEDLKNEIALANKQEVKEVKKENQSSDVKDVNPKDKTSGFGVVYGGLGVFEKDQTETTNKPPSYDQSLKDPSVSAPPPPGYKKD